MDGSGEMVEYLYKVLVVGDVGTGKTSIIKRYVHNLFSSNYKSTIGVDFALKVMQWDSNTVVRLQLWDIAGQERFGNMTRVYYKEAVAALVVYDVTRSQTFDAVQKWKADIDHKVFLPPDDRPIPVVLLANKCDLPNSVHRSPEDMNKFCEQMGFIGWFETSAKENVNIDTACRFLVEKILANDAARQEQEQMQARMPSPSSPSSGGGSSSASAASASKAQRVDLNATAGKAEEKSGCC